MLISGAVKCAGTGRSHPEGSVVGYVVDALVAVATIGYTYYALKLLSRFA
jgi:hypothetical protein